MAWPDLFSVFPDPFRAAAIHDRRNFLHDFPFPKLKSKQLKVSASRPERCVTLDIEHHLLPKTTMCISQDMQDTGGTAPCAAAGEPVPPQAARKEEPTARQESYIHSRRQKRMHIKLGQQSPFAK